MCAHTLNELNNKLRSGDIEIEDVIEEVLAQIDEKESEISALLPEKNRRQRLQQQARAVKDSIDNEAENSNIYGIPIGIKDIFHVDGFATRAGSRLDPEFITGEEGYIVSEIKKQGGLILGKTVTTEFAYFVPGPTRNPHNLAHTPGGSSSGSAAAVAAGYCPLALGTQTIGSVIRPAAFCGVIGFKPSYNRIPLEGLIKFSESADHIGFFTREVKGMELASEALIPSWKSEFSSRVSRPVLGLPHDSYLQQADRKGLKNWEESKKTLDKAGYKLVKTAILEDIEEINQAHNTLVAYEFARVHENWFEDHGQRYRKETVELIKTGQKIEKKEYLQAKEARLHRREELHNRMRRNGVDIIISPAAPGPAPQGIDSTGDPVMNLPWTNTGLPAVTVPSGISAQELPFGLQLVAEYERDEKLLKWADEIAGILQAESKLKS